MFYPARCKKITVDQSKVVKQIDCSFIIGPPGICLRSQSHVRIGSRTCALWRNPRVMVIENARISTMCVNQPHSNTVTEEIRVCEVVWRRDLYSVARLRWHHLKVWRRYIWNISCISVVGRWYRIVWHYFFFIYSNCIYLQIEVNGLL